MKLFRNTVLILFAVTCGVFFYYQTAVIGKLDRVPPTISFDKDVIEIGVGATSENLLSGVTAADAEDGDVSDSLIVESTTRFSSKGKCEITYAAFDEAGNVARATRTLIFTDYESPKIYLSAPLRMEVGNYSGDTLLTAFTAEDCIDGDISGRIKYAYGEDMNAGTAGKYVMAVQVSNSFGDTSKLELELEYLDYDTFDDPHPLLEQYILYTTRGKELKLSENVIGVQQNNSQFLFRDKDMKRYERDQIRQTGSNVDYDKPGIYTVTFSLFQENEEKKEEMVGSVNMFVVVE